MKTRFPSSSATEREREKERKRDNTMEPTASCLRLRFVLTLVYEDSVAVQGDPIRIADQSRLASLPAIVALIFRLVHETRTESSAPLPAPAHSMNF